MVHTSTFSTRALALVSLASFAAVATVLIAQHKFGVRPCAWCVMLRAIFLLLGTVAGAGLLLRGVARKASLLSVLGLAICGVAASAWQNLVASKSSSCAMTLADRINTALGLEEMLPSVFMVTASCAEASGYSLLGLPYEVWGSALCVAIAAVALTAIRKD